MTAGLEKIVTGGQSGVDRAALDSALAAGLACGGWCPLGRRAEDGPIPLRYPLCETPDADPAQRTAWNARDSDATIALARGDPGGGTAFALERAAAEGRPCLRVDLSAAPEPAAVRAWLAARGVRVLHVAGPRESEAPGVYVEALRFLTEVLRPAPP